MVPVRQFLTALAFAQEVSLPGTVQCAIVSVADGSQTKQCSLFQQQVAQQTGQRALMIELTAENETARGTLVLPFGLDLPQGVAYQLDEGASVPRSPSVPVCRSGAMIASLKTGTTLKVRATPVGGQEMTLSISLAGFASAYDRVVDLLRT